MSYEHFALLKMSCEKQECVVSSVLSKLSAALSTQQGQQLADALCPALSKHVKCPALGLFVGSWLSLYNAFKRV